MFKCKKNVRLTLIPVSDNNWSEVFFEIFLLGFAFSKLLLLLLMTRKIMQAENANKLLCIFINFLKEMN